MTDTPISSDLIAEALTDALFDADTAHLREYITQYKQKYKRTWNDLHKHPFCCKLLDAIEEACEYNAIEQKAEEETKNV